MKTLTQKRKREIADDIERVVNPLIRITTDPNAKAIVVVFAALLQEIQLIREMLEE